MVLRVTSQDQHSSPGNSKPGDKFMYSKAARCAYCKQWRETTATRLRLNNTDTTHAYNNYTATTIYYYYYYYYYTNFVQISW